MKALAPFVTLIGQVKRVFAEEGLGKGLEELLRELHYQQYLTDEYEDAAERWENVIELMNDIYEYEASAEYPDLAHYLSEVTLIQDIDLLGREEADAVSVMTLHKAKGLEYDSVMISGLEDNILPHANSQGSYEELEEERRLFYVGLTRARKRVILTYSQAASPFSRGPSVFFSGDGAFSRPSRFLDEIPSGHKEEPGKEAFHAGRVERRNRSTLQRVKLKTGTKVYHETWGEGFILATKMRNYVIDFSGSLREVDPSVEKLEVIS